MTLAAAIDAIRELVVAAEAAGWDVTENKEILQRGRDAHETLQQAFAGLERLQKRILS